MKAGNPALAPRNTLFRDGVSVSYHSLAHWYPTPISDAIYEKIFNIETSDHDISEWYAKAQISGAERSDWTAWRTKIGKSVAPDGLDIRRFDLEQDGWGQVSKFAHQAACRTESNELFDALVFSRKWAN